MRKVINVQMRLGAVDISQIEFDLRSRDEIPKLLMGLQYIYCTPELKEEVFKILEELVPKDVDKNKGRPGMDLWKILVLGTIRVNCNWDYDKLQDICDNHTTLRLMLGHGILDRELYPIQTIKDNLTLFTPEILDRINQIIVKYGHKLVFKNREEMSLRGRCDSFVVETDVHYPTDINLLFDAVRKVITLIAAVCFSSGITTWRQSDYNIRKTKKLFRRAQNLKRSNAKDEKKKEEREELIKEAHRAYIDLVRSFLARARDTIKTLKGRGLADESELIEIEKYIQHADRQIDQIQRRIIKGEVIPHNEKVFSIFEEHTEWISKGKAGVSQELGLRVCILEDQHGFILHHHVMERQTDDQVAMLMVSGVKQRFPELQACSFDRGFYTPENRKELSKELELLVMPKKGHLSGNDLEIENDERFVQYKRKHSAVESAINAVENHGLDRCLDHGIAGFKRYVSLSIVARNIQILGTVIQKNKINAERRMEGLILWRKGKACKKAA